MKKSGETRRKQLTENVYAYMQCSDQNSRCREWANGEIYLAIGFSIASIAAFLPDRTIKSVWV
jgi:hypothetical protein